MSKQDYEPSQIILEKYAGVLINLALGNGKGIKKNDIVYVYLPEYAKPFLEPLQKAVLKSGGHLLLDYKPDNTNRIFSNSEFFKHANESQIKFFPDKYVRGLVDQVDHTLFILCDTDPLSMKNVSPEKIMKHEQAWKRYKDWRFEKVGQGKLSWSIALYGTPGMAKEAGLSIQEYWQQIIQACYLHEKDPIKSWKQAFKLINSIRQKLNKLDIEKLNILGPDADLWITLGEHRQWLGGGGANIPSFEVFTSPDWRGTEGYIKFNQPLYRYGTLIEGIELEFKKGKVVKSKATKNYRVLEQMIKSPNADKVGEFSLTDKRLSRITKFMAETLFDENMGGKEGNTHIALGSSYHDTYLNRNLNKNYKKSKNKKTEEKMTEKEWQNLGFNDSAVHTDIISTSPRTVTAYLKNGQEKVIYKNGEFII